MNKRIVTILLLFLIIPCFALTGNGVKRDSTLRFRHSISVNIPRTIFKDYFGYYQYRFSKKIALGIEAGYAEEKITLAEHQLFPGPRFFYEGPEINLIPKLFFESSDPLGSYEIYFALDMSYQYRSIDYEWIYLWNHSEPVQHALFVNAEWKKCGINFQGGIASKPNHRFYYDFFGGFGLRYHDRWITYYEQHGDIPYTNEPLPYTYKEKYWMPIYIKLGFRIGFSF